MLINFSEFPVEMKTATTKRQQKQNKSEALVNFD